jgi:Tfp pilus assembly protein PilO
MKKYFAQLRPFERRLAVGVVVMLFLVLNGVFIYPHFSDWGNLRHRMVVARGKLNLYQAAIAQMPAYQAQVNSLQIQGSPVELEDMAVNMLRTIQSQSAESGVRLVNNSRQSPRGDDPFFVEQVQTIEVQANDMQLVDFLYKLGSGASMIRVRDLELQPDAPHQNLNAHITLIASYQKNVSADNLKPATAKAK